jgi:P-type Cu+ transporter
MATVKDPVCGMDIDPEGVAATSDYEGTTYYFCAIGCKERFDAEPAKFLSAAGGMTAAEPRRWWQFWRR